MPFSKRQQGRSRARTFRDSLSGRYHLIARSAEGVRVGHDRGIAVERADRALSKFFAAKR
jgi:hypothetical protein